MVRTDLPIPQQIVQACHVAIDAGRGLIQPDSPHPHLVVCSAPDQIALCHALERFERLGVPLRAFREPDRGNELTALAVGPVAGAGRRPFRRYRCLTAPGFT